MKGGKVVLARVPLPGMSENRKASTHAGRGLDCHWVMREVGRAPKQVGRAPRQVGRAPRQVGRAPRQVGRAPRQVGRACVPQALLWLCHR